MPGVMLHRSYEGANIHTCSKIKKNIYDANDNNVHMFVLGICLFLSMRYSAVDSYSCTHFQSGCPNSSHVSAKLFESEYLISQLKK